MAFLGSESTVKAMVVQHSQAYVIKANTSIHTPQYFLWLLLHITFYIINQNEWGGGLIQMLSISLEVPVGSLECCSMNLLILMIYFWTVQSFLAVYFINRPHRLFFLWILQVTGCYNQSRLLHDCHLWWGCSVCWESQPSIFLLYFVIHLYCRML